MLPFELTKDTPYLALSGELWSVFCEYFNRNWPCYKGFLLYMYHCYYLQQNSIELAVSDKYSIVAGAFTVSLLSGECYSLTIEKSTPVRVIMGLCRQATSHYLSPFLPRSMTPYGNTMTPYGNTRPQWFKPWLTPYSNLTRTDMSDRRDTAFRFMMI